ncbi:MAG: ABC transporter permease [Proteobacteria bacterium]|nr:ABC transporter permease [Pseudomonadota bacterium]
MAILKLSLMSLLNRKATVVLTIIAIAVSVTLLLGVDKLRDQARTGFANTISGSDMIIGARSGSIQLLLYSVFRIGSATNNITWQSYLDLAADPRVKWSIPLSMGDSHHGFRVLGTTGQYFEHYRYGGKQKLAFAEGKAFDDVFDVVIGADVAKTLGYGIGAAVVVQHGIGAVGFVKHEDKPFRVSGILRRTGTPVDRTVHITLKGIEAMHIDWQTGAMATGRITSADAIRRMDLPTDTITAILVGLKSRTTAFSFQRHVNDYKKEPLLGVLPGLALQELWSLMSTVDKTLGAIAAFVVVSGLLGMTTMILAGLDGRRREMAILRSVGARPVHVFGLLVTEATILTLVGSLGGVALLYLGLFLARPLAAEMLGLNLIIGLPSPRDVGILGLVVGAGFFAGLFPAFKVYRQSLADGMMTRL